MTKAENASKWRAEHREEYLQQCRDRYQLRRKKKICNQCGAPSGEKSWCEECLKKKGGIDGP